MPAQLPQDEDLMLDEVKAAIKDLWESVSDIGLLHTQTPYAPGPEEQIAAFYITDPVMGDLVFRTSFLKLVGYNDVDSASNGKTDLTLRFEIITEFQYFDIRDEGGGNFNDSENELDRMLMREKTVFKRNRTFGYPGGVVRHKKLNMEERPVLIQDEEQPDDLIHQAVNILEVVVYGRC